MLSTEQGFNSFNTISAFSLLLCFVFHFSLLLMTVVLFVHSPGALSALASSDDSLRINAFSSGLSCSVFVSVGWQHLVLPPLTT